MSLQHLYNDPAARRVLEERAQELARREQQDTMILGEEIVVFQLGQARYALPTSAVTEVHPLGHWTPLPATPPWVIGLVNVRGHILCAIDIRPLLDVPPSPPRPQSTLIRVNANGLEVGIMADTVVEVRYSTGDITPAFSTAQGRGGAWVKGIDSQLTLMLDPAMLTDSGLIVDDSAATSYLVEKEPC